MTTEKLRKLYESEARDTLAQLGRALLALETEANLDAVNEAFRCAHNLKSLSASMGDTASASRAHALEDRLSALRDSGEPPTSDTVDALLGAADGLQASIEADLATIDAPDTMADGSQAEPVTDDASEVSRDAPEPVTVVVRLRPDTPLKAARAVLIRTAVDRAGSLIAMRPDAPGDDFDGVLEFELAPGTDVEAIAAAVRAAGDVLSVEPAGADEASTAEQHDGTGATVPSRPEASIDEAARSNIDADAATALSAPEAGGEQSDALSGMNGVVRLDPGMLDAISDAVTELAVLHSRLRSGAATPGHVAERMGLVLGGLQLAVLEARMVPVGVAFERYPRMVRDAARQVGKEVQLVIEGEDARLDRSILGAILDPLSHLLRNAVDHGIESPTERAAQGKKRPGTLRLSASRVRSSLVLEVEDDGCGIDAERVAARAGVESVDEEAMLRLLGQPGFSLSENVTELSGRGVGLDVVLDRVRRLGGVVGMKTNPGTGTTFTLRLPITLALTQAMRVGVGLEEYTIPLTHIAEVIELDEGNTVGSNGREAVRLRDEIVPLIRMRRLLGVETSGAEGAAVIADLGDRRSAIAVDQLVAREQIVVRPIDVPIGAPPWLAGATLGADGRPILVLDPASVA